MTWPRNPRIDRSKLYRDVKPATSVYRDNAEISGEITLADLRHLVDGTSDWPADASVTVLGAPSTGWRQITVTVRESM